MSEMTKPLDKRTNLRAKLLTTASGTVLLVAICASQTAAAADADLPIVWIELGGAFTQLENGQEAYLPPFVLGATRLPFITMSPAGIEKAAPTSWDGNAKLTFDPAGTDWILSAGIIYGRSVRSGAQSQQTAHRSPTERIGYRATQSATAKNNESHMILDFQATKDVGLGAFGNSGRSRVSLGVRYAQFNSESDVNTLYQPTNAEHAYHKFHGSLDMERKFTGVGPSLSWDASAGLIGDATDGGISLDWGVNGAILFGHQRVRGHHQTTNLAVVYSYRYDYTLHKKPVYQDSVALNRDKQVIVPNFGGFAGVSWRYPNAKVSFGYRADMFFRAIDGGIDARKTYDRGFYGPFAAISIGIGD